MDAVNVIKGTVTISTIFLLTTLIIDLMIAPPDESTTQQVPDGVESPDPEINSKLSLQAKMNELSDISARLKILSDSQSEMEESLSRLIKFENVDVGSGEEVLTERKVNDIETWMSAAMRPMKTTDEVDTCSAESETGTFDGVMGEMQKSKEIMSDCLAIIADIQTHLQEKLGHTTQCIDCI